MAQKQGVTGGRKRKRQQGPKYLSQDEIKRLFSVIRSVRDRAMFRVAYHAGLRACEVGKLQMRDWNARTERIYVTRAKGSLSGEHHCTREESKALRAWLRERGDDPGPIFPSNRGRGISRQMLDVLMKHYGEQADLPPALRHFHALKHSCAVHLLELGLGVEVVQDWIGHASIANTMIYARITNRRRDEAAAQLRDRW